MRSPRSARAASPLERIRTGTPAMMDPRFQDAIEAASKVFAGGRSVRMPSGAGHDAQVARNHHARWHAVRVVDRRHQSSLDREYGRCRHRDRRAGLCRRLPAASSVVRTTCRPHLNSWTIVVLALRDRHGIAKRSVRIHTRLWNAGSPAFAGDDSACCRHTFAFSRRISPELCFVAPPSKSKRAQGRPGAGWHPRSAARKVHAGKPHSSIQVVPITRPSLRNGWTAYAVLSREPSSFWPPSPLRKSPTPRRLTRLPHSQSA